MGTTDENKNKKNEHSDDFISEDELNKHLSDILGVPVVTGTNHPLDGKKRIVFGNLKLLRFGWTDRTKVEIINADSTSLSLNERLAQSLFNLNPEYTMDDIAMYLQNLYNQH